MLIFIQRSWFPSGNLYFRSLKTQMGPRDATFKMAQKEITITAPWGKIAALSWGKETDPPVLLCHGKMDVATSFKPLVQLLPPTFHYVSIDLPGNGKSDQFPPKARFTVPDFVPTIYYVARYLNWDKFAYIGHSLGVIVGKYFNLAYPGRLTRVVELDPVPMYETWSPASFGHWYHRFYGEYYSEDTFDKYNGGFETAPKYTYEKARALMTNHRGLTEEAADIILERCLEPAGDHLYRFTYDQRLKEIPRLPLTPDYMKELYTSIQTPTFTFLSKMIIELGAYTFVPFIFDETAFPHKNYRVKTVEGYHDFHLNNPEWIADDISKFLLEDIGKAKL